MENVSDGWSIYRLLAVLQNMFAPLPTVVALSTVIKNLKISLKIDQVLVLIGESKILGSRSQNQSADDVVVE